MPEIYAHVHVPNAKRLARRSVACEEVRALVNVIRRTATGPKGQEPTLEDIAALLGVSPATLKSYHLKPRTDRSATQRGVPYTVLYALEAGGPKLVGVPVSTWIAGIGGLWALLAAWPRR